MNVKDTIKTALVGAKIYRVDGLEKESEEVSLLTNIGTLKFYHEQDCCEHVRLIDFECDFDFSHHIKIHERPAILSVEEVSNCEELGDGSDTWTFYKIETDKGGLWMRWLGESNGYYSEDVNIELTLRG